MKKITSLLFLVLLFTAITMQAAIKLPALVGDNMVLQRNTNINVWGEAKPGAEVIVTPSWNNKTYTTKVASDGQWKTSIPTPGAGGPYTITVSDGTPIVINNVMIGEVWVCSGQSNMEMPMKGFPGQLITNSNKDITASGKYKNLRLFSVARATSDTPLTDCKGSWGVSSPANTADFSATAYYFGRTLTEVLDIPIGLINTSWGGTWIEAWLDKDNISGVETERKYATQLYNAMIKPITNYQIAGFIWYQGESNKDFADTYTGLMDKMIKLWRNNWKNQNLPFYFVQIAPYVYNGADHTQSAYLREAQQKAMLTIPNTGMAVIMDQADKTNIHPANKEVVGDRLAYWALAKTYGVGGIAYRSPEYKSMVVDGDKVAVEFDYAPDGLAPWDTPIGGFEVAGEDKVFYPAQAVVDQAYPRNKVLVRSEQVKKPVAVRYCFKNYINGELFSISGLPVSSFRSDNW